MSASSIATTTQRTAAHPVGSVPSTDDPAIQSVDNLPKLARTHWAKHSIWAA
jgi:hypothetical protein